MRQGPPAASLPTDRGDRPPAILAILEGIDQVYPLPEVDVALRAVAGKKPDSDRLCRDALRAVLIHLLNGTCVDAAEKVGEVKKAIAEVSAQLNSLLSMRTSEDRNTFLVPGTLSSRYQSEHPEEKKELARYVVSRFFKEDERLRWFVQASVTAIHLAEELAKQRIIRPGSLVHTNSIVFPLLVLTKHSQVSVYAFSGTEYDDLCGGWLPSHGDDYAYTYLSTLFNREENPLQDSFITPFAVSASDGALYFGTSQLLQMVSHVVGLSRRAVLMTFSSRVFETLNEVSNGFMNTSLKAYAHPQEWRLRDGARTQLVVANDKAKPVAKQDAQKLIRALHKAGFDLHWQHADGIWNRYVHET